MKPSFFSPLPIFLYLTILFLQLNSFSADAGKYEVIEFACSATKARDLCISVIKSDPRSKSRDGRVFSIIVLEKAVAKANGIKVECPEAYKKLVKDAGDAIGKVKTDVSSAYSSIERAISDVASCPSADDSLVTLLSIARDVLKVVN